MKRRLIALLLAAAMVMSFAACNTSENDTASEEPVDSVSQPETDEGEPEENVIPGMVNTGTTTASNGTVNSNSIVEYVHYDPTEFYEKVEQLELLSDSDNTEELLNLYDELYKDAMYVMDLSWAAYIQLAMDNDSEYYHNEFDYSKSIEPVVLDDFSTAVHTITTGKNAQALKDHIANDDIYNEFVNYTPKSEKVLALFADEAALTSQYIVLEQGTETFYDESAEIFLNLVKTRNELARELGYENYGEYAYDIKYHRDFGREDVESFYAAVKSVDLERLYYLYCMLYYMLPEYNVTEKQAISDLKEVMDGVSDLTSEALDYMVTNHMYYYGNDYDKNTDADFCQGFRSNQSVFMYAFLRGHYSDMFYLVHELGHLSNSFFVPMSNPLFNEGCFDIFEVQSTGLEVLTTKKVSKFFCMEDTCLECYEFINNIYIAIVYGCLYDEWQWRVYEDPDITIEKMDEIFIELCSEYYVPPITSEADLPLLWRTLPHNYDNPFYYISYASSFFTSLQIWDMTITDYDKAVETYEKVLLTNPYTTSFHEMLENCGLRSFREGDYVKELITKALDYSEELVNEYYN